ncbi:hypothetical protein KZP23_21340 [Echinicola marina]|uniref:hypothetical protein n=1 Tax=Echinicola marina TaxID=2859768 RepID=UPI001CF6F1F9|nr:hypothetical protein [Echinicola marina]UCS93166.1 hypothetical protein KZP23_21340 [Echinicola marina]
MKQRSPVQSSFRDLLISITKRTDEENLKLFTAFHEANIEKVDYAAIQQTCQNFMATFMFETQREEEAIDLLYELLHSSTGDLVQASGTSFTLAKFLDLTERNQEAVSIARSTLDKYQIEWSGTLYLLKILAKGDEEGLYKYKGLIENIAHEMEVQLPESIKVTEAVLALYRMYERGE